MDRRMFMKNGLLAVLGTGLVVQSVLFPRNMAHAARDGCKKMFGALPDEDIIKEFLHSPHYYNGEFHNLVEHAVLSDKSSTVMALLRSVFVKKESPAPVNPLPAKKDAFAGLAKEDDVLVWLGHSSFFMQLSGKRILIDPVFARMLPRFSLACRPLQGQHPMVLAICLPLTMYLFPMTTGII